MGSQAKLLLPVLAMAFAVAALMSLYGLRVSFAGNCPIVFDLNGDGKISTTTQIASRGKLYTLQSLLRFVTFDIDGDGVKDRIEWIDGSGDGILVDASKVPSSLQIDGRALFGNINFENGFETLATRDVNHDQFLNGDELNGLMLWQDNGDAILQPGELKSLSSFYINSIALNKEETPDSDGNLQLASHANTDDNGSLLIEDVWFLNVAQLSSFEQDFDWLMTRFT